MNPTKATYWYPILAELDIPMPDARFVEMECMKNRDYMPAFDPEELRPEGWEPPKFTKLREAVEEMDGPVFLRSDLSSAKHDGITACRVDSADEVQRAAWRILEHHEMDFLGASPSHWMVRPYVPMRSYFKAFGLGYGDYVQDGLPIPPEYRVFATSKGEHVCTHPYWPLDAFVPGKTAPPDVEALLEQMWADTEEYVPFLEELALEAASHLTEAEMWSVDFAQAENGSWLLIDVAEAKKSWHPDSCESEARIRGVAIP